MLDVLPEQTFELQLSNSKQLDIIDQLRELNVPDFVALPQLVVVGDQSSGKSSVLEALSGLPFARDSGLCTRFATQITMRRTSYESITISIIPGVTSSADRTEKLRAFKREGLAALDGQEFLDIFQEACKAMNISLPGQTLEPSQTKTTFSNDVLKIELCGPQMENLSIIDIPGIFRTPTLGVTTAADMALVDDMVRGYIKDERTIILAVLPAPTDIATQSILTMAAEADPMGLRTLGVLTKPDLVDKGAEHNVIDLILGRRNKLHLGYCIVRNRGQAELDTDAATRTATENTFFNTGPWAGLDKDRVGVSALKQRLQELLAEITRREFPKVKLQIDRQLTKCKEKFAALGPDRESTEQQRRYLQEIAIQAQKLTDYAIDAYYSRSIIFDSIPEMRLSTVLTARDDSFCDTIAKKGHTVSFEIAEDDARSVSESIPSDETPSIADEDELLTIDKAVYPELSDLFDSHMELPEHVDDDVLEWIEKEFRRARGRGLEMIGPAVLPTLWQQQSKNWEVITMSYLEDAIYFVHDFICKLLQHVFSDKRTRIGLFSSIQDLLLERYQKAIDHVKFIIKVERFSTPLTLNHYYNDNLQKFRVERMQKAMEKVAVGMHDDATGQREDFVRLAGIANSVPMGNVEHTVLDIHSILKAYYKVARKRFVDMVCMQGTDYHLLSGEDSPLRIFSPLYVASLTPDQLELIAGEELSSKRQRKRLKTEIKALEEGKKLLRAV